MSTHDCPGLRFCYQHPRWNVCGRPGWWQVYGPGRAQVVDASSVHAEAVHIATSRARAEALAAVQSAEGVTAR